MKGNKGQLGIGILLVLVLILVGAFIFSKTFRFTTIGIALTVLAFVILINKNIIKKERLKVTLFVSLLAVGMVFIFGAGLLNSVLSLSSVNVGSDGKVYWVLTASADSFTDEGYQFSYKPKDYAKSDGTIIKPQESVILSFKKQDSYCEYRVQQTTFTASNNQKVAYNILSNPTRVSRIRVSDSQGNVKTIDATSSSPISLDSDRLTIKPQGVLSGPNDCPGYENVAIVEGRLVERNSYENYLDQCSRGLTGAISCLFNKPNINTNSQFITGFENEPTISSNIVRGDVNIGSGVFTITANQEYFNSVVVIPPKNADPRIDSIDIPSEIQEGKASSMKVIISNKNNDEGTISISATSSDLGISQSPQSKLLNDQVTVNFPITAGSDTGLSQVCVEVSSTGQFGSANRDSECKTFRITSDTPDTFCGDNICQSFESKNTCPLDCKDDPLPNPNIECKPWETRVTSTSKDYGLFGYRALVPGLDPLEVTTDQCKTSSLVNIILILITISGIAIFAIIYTTRNKRNKGRKKR